MYRQNLKTDIPEKVLLECNSLFDYTEKEYCHQNCRKDRITNLSALFIYNLISRRNYVNKKEKQNFMLVDLNMANYNLKTEPNPLSELGFTYHDIIHSLELLKELNIISIEKGYRTFREKLNDKWFYEDTKMTKIFINSIDTWNENYISGRIFELTRTLFFKHNDLSSEPLAVLNVKKKKKKVEVKSVDDRLNKKLKNVNDYLIKNELSDFCYQRKYSTTVKDPNTRHYGRVWSQFHMLTKEHRHILMEDMGLAEFDFKSCLLNILYTIETGHEYVGDLYNDAMTFCEIDIEKQPELRDVFKVIFIILLNCIESKSVYAIQTILNEKNLQELNVYDIIKKITKNFPVLKKYFFTKSSSLTQFIESEITIRVMNVMVFDSIIPLSIHDGFLFPINEIDYYSEVCNSIFSLVISNYISKSNNLKSKYIYSNNYFILSSYYLRLVNRLDSILDMIYYLKNRKMKVVNKELDYQFEFG